MDTIKGLLRKKYQQQYQEAKRQKFNEYAKKYYRAHKQEIKEHSKKYQDQYYQAHRERIIASVALTIKEHKQTDLDFLIKTKVNGVRVADAKAGRQYTKQDYITVDWVKQQLVECGSRCFHCQKVLKILRYEPQDPDQFSVNRLFLDMEHEQENCVISCWGCNLAHGDWDMF